MLQRKSHQGARKQKREEPWGHCCRERTGGMSAKKNRRRSGKRTAYRAAVKGSVRWAHGRGAGRRFRDRKKGPLSWGISLSLRDMLGTVKNRKTAGFCALAQRGETMAPERESARRSSFLAGCRRKRGIRSTPSELLRRRKKKTRSGGSAGKRRQSRVCRSSEQTT